MITLNYTSLDSNNSARSFVGQFRTEKAVNDYLDLVSIDETILTVNVM
jgi:hypothetical protein